MFCFRSGVLDHVYQSLCKDHVYLSLSAQCQGFRKGSSPLSAFQIFNFILISRDFAAICVMLHANIRYEECTANLFTIIILFTMQSFISYDYAE